MQSISLWPEASTTAQTSSVTLDIYQPFGLGFRDAAVLILPGGGYTSLSDQEGEGYAGWFQLHGFHSFVLNYRLGSAGHRHPAMLEDAARALRTVRARAGVDGFNPNKVIVIGSSAGGHLAATLLTHWDLGDPEASDPVERESSCPDLGILCYPVITMGAFTHEGSRANLLGADPSSESMNQLSAETQVRADTPPCFIWHTWEDPAVPVENAMLFAQSLRSAGVPFELHVYQDGGHGLGMKDGHGWTDACFEWLRRRLQ